MSLFKWLTGGDIPEAEKVQMSPGASDIIQSQYQESQKTPEQIQAEMTQGMDESKSLSQPIDQSYLGGQTNDMVSKALRSRSQRYISDDLSRMKNKMKHNVVDVQSKRLGSSAQSLQMQRNLDVENYRRQMDRHNAQVAARNQAISSIFQGAGMIAGAAIGGPAGAAMGSQVGGSVAPQKTQSQMQSEKMNPYGYS